MRAIDIHVHPITAEYVKSLGRWMAAQEDYFHVKQETKTPEQIANDYRRADVLGMLIGWDNQTITGDSVVTNDHAAMFHQQFPDTFLPGWAMVDPWKGKAALDDLERSIKQLGMIGPKWHPPSQQFHLNDTRFYPFWEMCQSLGAPILTHSGMTGLGLGMPGGGGVKNKFGRPFPDIDDLAADFPHMTIVAAHPGWPWTEELMAVALHKPNVFIEISGWGPKYLPEPLKRDISRRLQDKIIFGSDYPALNPAQMLDELEMLKFPAAVIEKVFFKNATRALKLEDKVKKAQAAAAARK